MRKELMNEICASQEGFRLLAYFSSAVFGIMLLWLPFVELQSATGVVVVINLIGASGFLIVSGFVLRQCEKRDEKRREEIQQAR